MFVGIKYVFDPWVMNCMGLYFYIQCEDKHENVEERQSLLYEGGLLLNKSLRKYPYAILDTKCAFTAFMFQIA